MRKEAQESDEKVDKRMDKEDIGASNKIKEDVRDKVEEGSDVKEEKLEKIMNSKSEYGHNVVPRMRIEVGARIMRDDELEEFRRQKVREAMEEDEEWEKNEGRGLAGKRDVEKID